jgi:DNA polymerase-3 subunit delta'
LSIEALPWHRPQWEQILATRSAGRLAHAFLLAGPRGVGKRQFATRLAAVMLCERHGNEACGDCRSCKLVEAGSHPNLQTLQPAEDKRDIAVEDVRELCERLSLTAHYGGAKVALVQPADALNANGVNALLKTIEEPPSGSYLFLMTDRPMLLAATLRSRCRFLRFAAPARSEGLAWLKARNPAADATALDFAHGAPLRALELVESGAIARYAQWQRSVAAIAAGQGSPLEIAVRMKKPDALEFIDWLMGWVVAQQRGLADGRPQPSGFAHAALDSIMRSCIEALPRLHLNAPPQLTIESIMINLWQQARSPTKEMRA